MVPGEKIRISREDYQELLDAQRALSDILKEIDNAEYCGIECQTYRAAHGEASTKIERLLERFGPDSKL